MQTGQKFVIFVVGGVVLYQKTCASATVQCVPKESDLVGSCRSGVFHVVLKRCEVSRALTGTCTRRSAAIRCRDATQNQAQRADERGGGSFHARAKSKQGSGDRLCAARANGTTGAVLDSRGRRDVPLLNAGPNSCCKLLLRYRNWHSIMTPSAATVYFLH